MKIGYARVSSGTQDAAMQEERLRAAGCEKIFTDSITGTSIDRPQLNELLSFAREGDIVYVCTIDRLARSIIPLMNIVAQLEERKIKLKSLDANDEIDTTTPMGMALFQIAGVFSQLDKSLINHRTRAGRERAIQMGMKVGRVTGSHNKNYSEKREAIIAFLTVGKTYDWISKQVKVSKQTIAQIKKKYIMEDKE